MPLLCLYSSHAGKMSVLQQQKKEEEQKTSSKKKFIKSQAPLNIGSCNSGLSESAFNTSDDSI